MCFSRRRKYILLPFLLLLWGQCAAAASLEFINFASRAALSPVSGDQYLFNNKVKVQAANRLVVKASSDVPGERLQGIDPRVTGVRQLYKLPNSTYHLVTFHGIENLSELLARFQSLPFIELAQPDLLQVNEKSGLTRERHEPADYIRSLDIESLWRKSMGRDVRIAIIDDGFDLEHEDLQGVKLAFGYDLETKTLDPSPRSGIDTHGTRVSGIIFARHNNVGIDGIAPDAELIAIRHTDTWTSATLLSFYLAKIAGADVINCSWKSNILLEPVADAIRDLAATGRQGRGLAVVFAAGNNSRRLQPDCCEPVLPQVITVGAVHPSGRRLPFSNYGQFIDIFTYGRDVLVPARGPEKYKLFSGTSASSAIVSGVAALLIAQDRELSLADLQQRLHDFFTSR